MGVRVCNSVGRLTWADTTCPPYSSTLFSTSSSLVFIAVIFVFIAVSFVSIAAIFVRSSVSFVTIAVISSQDTGVGAGTGADENSWNRGYMLKLRLLVMVVGFSEM